MRWLSKVAAWVLSLGLGLSACLAQATASQGTQAPLEALEAPVISLLQGSARISLDRQARIWLEPGRIASAAQALAVFQQPPSGTMLELRPPDTAYMLDGRAMWLHFSAHNLSPIQRWLVQVELPSTDLATLYYQRSDGSWAEQSAGDSLPHSQWATRSRYPMFSLSDDASQPVQYLLRIVHDRVPYSAAIHLYNDELLIESRQAENLFLGGYFGITLAVVVMCLAQAFALRYANYLRYAAYVAILGLTQISFLGLGTQYITRDWVAWNSVSSFVMPMWSVVTALWFVRALVRPEQFSKKLDVWTLLLMALMAVVALVETFKPSLAGFRVLNGMMLVGMASLYLILWRSGKLGDKNARWIALGFLPIVLTALFPILRNFGVGTTGFLTQYAVTLGSAIEVPLLMYALTQRSARLRDMRVREQALLQQDALTGLADERRFVSKMHGSLLRARRHNHAMAMLHVNMSNHDRMLGEFGAQVANAALLLTASQLRQVSRDIDMPARLEGNNFALLIEGPITPARVIEMATHLLAQSLRPSEALPVGLQPKLRICAALLPDEQADALGEDANTHYQWMISQVELALAEDSKKAIRALNF